MQQLKSGSSLQGGKYKIEKVLGQGGFGITYLATQDLLDRKVCIKEFFFKEYCERDESTSRVSLGTQSNHETVERFMNKFLKEARTISQLDHPNIIHIYDIFRENNTAYYVMEYIDGESLADKVTLHGAMPESDAIDYIRQVASALEFIHQRGINHLDVKPANIMVRRADNRAILIDFGLSKQYDEQGGQTSTTPVGISQGYAPMEQYNAGGVSTFSPQTDIYSLGATLYKLITGNTPPQAIEVFNEELPPLPSSVSSPVAETIKKAMQPRKGDRPDSISKFLIPMDMAVHQSTSAQQVSESKQDLEHDEETKVIVETHAVPETKTASTTISQEPQKKSGKIGRIAVLALILMLCVGGYYAYTRVAYSKMTDNLRTYLILINEGDNFLSVEKYPESIRKYEQAQNFEREYSNTKYAGRFNKKAARKISDAQKAEEEHKAELARLEKARLAASQQQAALEAEEERKAAEYRRTHGNRDGHEYADLGLSVKWATNNVGAYSPESYGYYFEWSEPKWGNSWRLPTKYEFQELIDKCTWYWTSLGGKNGCKIVGPNGNSIFLPAAGYQIASIFYEGIIGCYWTSYPASEEYNHPRSYNLKFDKNSIYIDSSPRRHSLTIRLVTY